MQKIGCKNLYARVWRREFDGMCFDVSLLTGVLDIRVWRHEFRCESMDVGVWRQEFGGRSLNEEVWRREYGCRSLEAGVRKRVICWPDEVVSLA